MKIALRVTLGLTVIGLALLPAVESWRPGTISAAVNIGLVWVFVVASLFVLIPLIDERR